MNQRKAGVVISYIGQAVNILIGLVYTPVMLRLLGKSEYGLYQLVYSVVSYLSLLSLGFGSSYMRFYAREKAKGNDDGVAVLNGMFLLIFLVISGICILCGGVLLKNIRTLFAQGLTDSEYDVAGVLMKLMIINLALTFPNTVFNCIITSQERFVFQKTLILIHHLLNPFLSLPLLLMGYGSIGMVAATTAATLIVLVTNMFYCFRKIHCRFLFRGMRFSILKEMWAFTFFIFLNQIVDQINWSVDKFLLGRMAGSSAVALYGVGAQINTLYVHFSSSISNVFVPRVNRAVAEGEDDSILSNLFTKVGRIQFFVIALIVTGFIFFGRPFISFWAGKQYKDAYGVVLFLIIPAMIPLIQNMGIEIQRAKNKHKARSIVYFFIAISNIFISIPLIRKWGPVGAAAGTMISLLAGNGFFMNWYYHNRLDIDIIAFWKSIGRIIPSLIIPIITGVVSMLVISYDSIIKLACGIVVYTIIYCVCVYLWGMDESEKKMVTSIRSKLKRFRKAG